MTKRAEESALNKRVTLQTLAQHLGLSTTTVSVVVSGAPASQGIPLRTRERILEAAEVLKYTPNYMARSLRRTHSMSIGILAPEISEGYLTRVMHGVEQYLMNARYLYFKASHHHRQEMIEQYARLLVERSVDGLLLINTPVPPDITIPVVSISGRSELPGVTNVLLDHRRAAVMALEYLRDLGHTRIAFMKGQMFNADAEPRWQSIVDAAQELDVDDRSAVDGAAGAATRGRRAWGTIRCGSWCGARATLRRSFASMIFRRWGRSGRCTMRGIRVPEDVSVIGFDDITGAAYGIPSLTTVRQPLEEMGRLAAATLLERIKNPGWECRSELTLQPGLVVRESTARAREEAARRSYGAA